MARASHIDQWLWHEMTNRYYADQDAKRNQYVAEKLESNYQQNFRQMRRNDQAIEDVKYPLYGRTVPPISFWNQTEAINFKAFKQYHPFTKLNIECYDEQRR